MAHSRLPRPPRIRNLKSSNGRHPGTDPAADALNDFDAAYYHAHAIADLIGHCDQGNLSESGDFSTLTWSTSAIKEQCDTMRRCLDTIWEHYGRVKDGKATQGLIREAP